MELQRAVQGTLGVEAERLEGQAGEVREALARGLVADTDDTERDTRRLQVVGHGHELLTHLGTVELAQLRKNHDERAAACEAVERRDERARARVLHPRRLELLVRREGC